MFYRLLLLFCVSFSFAQDSLKLDLLKIRDVNNYYFFEISNLGDPLVFLTPLEDNKEIVLEHISSKVRKLDYFYNINNFDTDTIYSHVIYQGAYDEGGVLETCLIRPIGKNLKLNFTYNNLSSLGFYINQKNQNSYLNFKINYNSPNNPFSYYFLFSSNNGFYNQNGGLKQYDANIDHNLMLTHLNAENYVKNRKIETSHNYAFRPKLNFTYTFLFNSFTKNYFDSSPSSYHYDLISYDISSNNSYVDSLSFKTMSNAISISNNNINFKIKHSIYKNNHYDLTNSGDIDFMLTSIKKFKNNRSVDFFINYCPIGYNQKSFIFDINFYKNKRNNSHILNFMWSLKRPKLTHNIYDHVDNFNWSDFDYPSTISLKFKSIFNNRSLKISSIFRHYLNYLYFNHMILPIQSDQSVFYYNLKLEKTFKIKHISLSTVFFLQKSSDDNSLPLPLFIFDQRINYDRLVFSDIRLLSSFNMRLFSKYNMPSYFPLTDVFYNQSHTQTGMIPLTSMSIHLYKKYFSIGFILDNLHSPFYKGASLIQDYFLSPFILRTSLKWQFID